MVMVMAVEMTMDLVMELAEENSQYWFLEYYQDLSNIITTS